MASYNKVILLGNLTRDPELKYLGSGTAVVNATLAVNDRRKDAQGSWVEETCFVDVAFWGKTAETVSQYLTKGSAVLVEGRLRQEKWEHDGQKRSKHSVTCDRMQMVGSKSDSGGSVGGSQPGPSGLPNNEPPDEVPF